MKPPPYTRPAKDNGSQPGIHFALMPLAGDLRFTVSGINNDSRPKGEALGRKTKHPLRSCAAYDCFPFPCQLNLPGNKIEVLVMIAHKPEKMQLIFPR